MALQLRRVVVDASVSIKWHLPEPDWEAALALQSGPDELIAPVIWLGEMTNAVWAAVQTRRITVDDARVIVRELQSAPVALRALDDLLSDAFEIAAEIPHPIYDCLYLALAQAEGCQVVTADKRLQTVVAGTRFAPLVRPLTTT